MALKKLNGEKIDKKGLGVLKSLSKNPVGLEQIDTTDN